MRALNILTLLAAAVLAHIPDYNDDLWDSEGNETCRVEAELTSPFWLHRWIGTYYNGTIVRTRSIARLLQILYTSYNTRRKVDA